jgi:hypothetical protein
MNSNIVFDNKGTACGAVPFNFDIRNAIEIQSHNDDFQLSVCFRKNGVNQLMSMDRIKLAGRNGVSETKACTDEWSGGYIF